MTTKQLIIFTRTPLHVGSGGGLGPIDLPVQRERHTRHPIIPGSSIKGVFRYTATSLDSELGSETLKIDDLFGPEDPESGKARSGDLTFTEARPLAFPVRSAKGAFAYITCPMALQRFARDSGLTGLSELPQVCLLYTSPSPRDQRGSRMPSSA